MEKEFGTSLELAQAIADFASGIKAEDIVILDMRKVANFCDYFVVCSGNSSRQVRSIAEEIEEKLIDAGQNARYKQGAREGRWVLIDLGTVVAHVFDKDTRAFYGLEYLWQEALKVPWEEKTS